MHHPRQLGVWQWKLCSERLSAMLSCSSRNRWYSSSVSSCVQNHTAWHQVSVKHCQALLTSNQIKLWSVTPKCLDLYFVMLPPTTFYIRCVKVLLFTSLISRSSSLLSHASGQDTSASWLFTIVPFRHSLKNIARMTKVPIYQIQTYSRWKLLERRHNYFRIITRYKIWFTPKPAKGVQTLSEHNALSWLQRGEADGTVCLCRVGDNVLFFCGQNILVVLLSFLLLSLHHPERKRTIQRFILN